VASRLGLHVAATRELYDLVIVGAGPTLVSYKMSLN
jgi:hypothetical protein